jgi:multiple sugar transport system ATP-binding protein
VAEIALRNVNKVYADGTHAVHDASFHIADGEFMIMVGPSGCAKSTILRMIAGLEVPTSGSIEIGGRVMNDVSPKDRDIAMVFQSYALYPHMSVADNMAFGLRLRKMPDNQIQERINEAARILGLEQLLHRLPKQLSGGQRQRVAMGRAIVREPQAFLMDEPLSNLDAKLRVQMRTEIAKLHARLQTTTVYVTHDQVEAMTLGQRICILRKGVVHQVDTPHMVYTNPADVFVAGFIGSPGMNFMEARLVAQAGDVHLQLGSAVLPLPSAVRDRLYEAIPESGRPVLIGIRPEHLHETSAHNAHLIANVDLVESMGAESFVYFGADVPQPNLVHLSDTQANDVAVPFVAKFGPVTAARPGGQFALAMDLAELHIFDPQTYVTMLSPRAEQIVLPSDAVVAEMSIPGPVQPIEAAFDETPVASRAHARNIPGPARSAAPVVPPAVAGGESPSPFRRPIRPAGPKVDIPRPSFRQNTGETTATEWPRTDASAPNPAPGTPVLRPSAFGKLDQSPNLFQKTAPFSKRPMPSDETGKSA